MYENFYGLNSKPFQLNPDPSFYFGSKQHRRAKAYLEYGVQRNEGFIVITGEIGAGKTTIVRGLLASLDPEKVVAANLVTTRLNAEDTLRMVGAAFGVQVKNYAKADLLMALEAYLVNQTSQGKRCLLIVDEAQNLTVQAVEELRMLSNFQFGQQALLQTFLVGQPEFRMTLQSPAMEQLKQRITATCHIGPLATDETRGYIEHRLKCAGATGRPNFDTAAFDAIFKASGGIPRRINLICDRLLLLGYLGNKDTFGLEEVGEVVKEIQDESTVLFNNNTVESIKNWSTSTNQNEAFTELADIAHADLKIPPSLMKMVAKQIDDLGDEQYDARIQRLENSILRLERINLEVLMMLKRLAGAVKNPSVDDSP